MAVDEELSALLHSVLLRVFVGKAGVEFQLKHKPPTKGCNCYYLLTSLRLALFLFLVSQDFSLNETSPVGHDRYWLSLPGRNWICIVKHESADVADFSAGF